MSDTQTRGVRIQVTPRYVPEQSQPDSSHYLFAYHVRISNVGATSFQVVSRHWIITNGEGHAEEVRGPGVVGMQPLLKPGEQFEYTSACPLNTPVGTMHGSFECIDDSGDAFPAYIQPFRLAIPGLLN